MLYSSGTTGRPKGVNGSSPPSDPLDTPTPVNVLRAACCSASPTRPCTSSPAPLPTTLGPVAVQHGAVQQSSGTRGRHGALRSRAEALAADRAALTGDVQPVGADHAHPHVEAARRRAHGRYDVSKPRGGGARRRSLHPGRGQGPDDRVVGGDPARVLRRDRGQRVRLHQCHRLAGPPRHGGAQPDRGDPHPRRRWRRGAGGRGRHHLVRRQRRVRVPQRPGQDGRVAPPQGSRRHPHRRHQSAASTTTASST